ncbi:dermonecrotic toxin domain-containing protein [Pseudomonas vancouverensis]|uniref:dermonecrotic toxin domain-containing protein n=1 Tax=Pseudomonas vancouverensis TaxID=95300 RepID=UPI003CFF3D74
MTAHPISDLPVPSSPTFAPRLPLPLNHDENSYHTASARWHASNQAMHELMAATPRIRDSIEQLLKQELSLDGQQAGLLFNATAEHSQRFVSFIDACAFVVQHPTLEPTLDQRCRVHGLDQGHALSPRTPSQILERLKTLDPENVHNDRWRTFWDSRAPGTAISRKSRATDLYRTLFEAAAQMALALRRVTPDQFKVLDLLINPPAGAPAQNGQALISEKLSLVLSNRSKVKLTGAWVITLGDPAHSPQWLFLPNLPVAVRRFDKRSDMETWLSQQSLVPKGLPADNHGFEYTADTQPMIAGASDVFAAHQQAQISALRHATAGKPGLAEHGAQSLTQADQAEAARRGSPVFASPPTLPSIEWQAGQEQLPLFGNLNAGIPWTIRQAALRREREALEKLLDQVGEGAGLQPFKDSLKALENAEEAADKAATALLKLSSVRDAVQFQREFTALLTAHRGGLQAEAALQLTLGQLSDNEYEQLKTMLATPDNPGPDRVAASLSLTMTKQEGGNATTVTENLHGAFVITHPHVLVNADTQHAVLLYWPGAGGGLQRFANRRDLEQQAFKIHDHDSEAALRLDKITGNPIVHGLKQLTDAFETQADAIGQRLSLPTDATQRAEQLDILQQSTLAGLQVPLHAARSLAFTHLQEQDRSAALATSLPHWLSNTPAVERVRLKSLINAYIEAMFRSHALMGLSLIPRHDFTRARLQARLRKDFSIKGTFDVHLDLPDSVTWEKRYTAGPAGRVETSVMVAGASRSKMSLEDLAQLNIDNLTSVQNDALSQRLVFMQLEVTAADNQERITLSNGINLTYLRKVLPELDLPQAYERLIFDTYKGATSEPVFVRDHRRESLIEPWRLMLKLQGRFTRLQSRISEDELQILNIAIDANTPQAWHAAGKRVVIRPVSLAAGGKDTPGEGPTTLSGLTFIEEQLSGTTLLYLPDSPDGQFLRRYDNLEAARKALFNLGAQDQWVKYLAGRTIHGDARAHELRIIKAVSARFDGVIGVGVPWPATTSLAAHLLDADMGLRIEIHRRTSRSNGALALERYAMDGPRAFNYLKMALGILPFIGTAIALYDAWTAANRSVAAFLRGQVGDGLEELKTVLLCLMDAAMELLPGEAATAALASFSRSLTRTRQLHGLARQLSAMQQLSLRQAAHRVARFAGYEYEKPLSLSGLQPGSHGLYRNVYRHADGDFIERQGRIYQVALDSDSRMWRLSGNSRKTYKQPISLDETGQWDTWFGVYGTTFAGGGPGGGSVLGHLADAFDPVWPPAIRQRLPRWWADRSFRRHHQLTEQADDIADLMETRMTKSSVAINQYATSAVELRPTLRIAAEAAAIGDIELAIRHYQALAQLLPLTHGNKRRALLEFQSNTALLLTDRFQHRVYYANHRAGPLIDRIDELTDQLDELPEEALDQRLGLLEQIRTVRVELLRELDQVEAMMRDLNLWYERMHFKSDKVKLSAEVSALNHRLSESNMLHLKTGHLLEIVKRFDSASDVSWFYLQNQADSLRTKVDRALFTQFELPDVSVTKAQRNRILQDCLDLYTQFRRDMRAWTTSYPQHFNMDAVEPLLTGIEKIAERARKGIDLPAPAAPAGRSNKKVFTTEDDQLLIGVERWEPTTQARQYTLTGQHGYLEVWEQNASGKFRLLNPPAPASTPLQRDLAALVADARKRLDSVPTYQAKVQSYAAQDMLPVDLEHMLVSEADELGRRALRIEEVDAQNPIIAPLRDKAVELRSSGRALRTRQSLTSKKPTDGMLDDLIGQNAVEIRKTSAIKSLGKRKDGRIDYLQEYEIHDLTQESAVLLWYAHFHYSSQAPVLRQFEKAHLKLPEHRFLTHADDANLPYADIGKQSVALAHFDKL